MSRADTLHQTTEIVLLCWDPNVRNACAILRMVGAMIPLDR
jgi:hypothetical protein